MGRQICQLVPSCLGRRRAGTPVLNVHVVALWEALEMKVGSLEKPIDVTNVQVLKSACGWTAKRCMTIASTTLDHLVLGVKVARRDEGCLKNF